MLARTLHSSTPGGALWWKICWNLEHGPVYTQACKPWNGSPSGGHQGLAICLRRPTPGLALTEGNPAIPAAFSIVVDNPGLVAFESLPGFRRFQGLQRGFVGCCRCWWGSGDWFQSVILNVIHDSHSRHDASNAVDHPRLLTALQERSRGVRKQANSALAASHCSENRNGYALVFLARGRRALDGAALDGSA